MGGWRNKTHLIPSRSEGDRSGRGGDGDVLRGELPGDGVRCCIPCLLPNPISVRRAILSLFRGGRRRRSRGRENVILCVRHKESLEWKLSLSVSDSDSVYCLCLCESTALSHAHSVLLYEWKETNDSAECMYDWRKERKSSLFLPYIHLQKQRRRRRRKKKKRRRRVCGSFFCVHIWEATTTISLSLAHSDTSIYLRCYASLVCSNTLHVRESNCVNAALTPTHEKDSQKERCIYY